MKKFYIPIVITAVSSLLFAAEHESLLDTATRRFEMAMRHSHFEEAKDFLSTIQLLPQEAEPKAIQWLNSNTNSVSNIMSQGKEYL